MRDLERIDTLVAIMDRLRDPDGCPWDREQTYESLRRYLLEECYEVVEALDHGDSGHLEEELGDLLFQIVFLSRLAKEDGRFTLDDVVRGIAEKLIRRHPHVFGTAQAETAQEVERHWERIKRQEKQAASKPTDTDSILDGIPSGLPAMLKAQRLGERAAAVGFDWTGATEVFAQIEDELRELRAAVDQDDTPHAREELGDVLFTVVMLARRLQLDAEGALEQTNLKFGRRFRWIERELARRGTAIEDADLELLERLWARAKTAGD